MLNRNRPQATANPRPFGVPSRRPDLFLQKENMLPNQYCPLLYRMPKPLISPKGQQSDRMPFDNHRANSYRSSNRSPHSLPCCNHPNKKA